jgi:hypothetical protein
MRKTLVRWLNWIGGLALDLASLIEPHPFDDIELLRQLSFCMDVSDLEPGQIIQREDLEDRIIKGMEAATWH